MHRARNLFSAKSVQVLCRCSSRVLTLLSSVPTWLVDTTILINPACGSMTQAIPLRLLAAEVIAKV